MAGRPAKRAPVKAKKFCPFDSERECGAECMWHETDGAQCIAIEMRDAVRKLRECAEELRRYV